MSSQGSFGMDGALDTLEREDFDFASSRSPSFVCGTIQGSATSSTSSPGCTYELHRNGSLLESRPKRRLRYGSKDSLGIVSPRRLARASLVSSTLLRSAGSIDGLRAMLDSPPDQDGDYNRSTSAPLLARQYSPILALDDLHAADIDKTVSSTRQTLCEEPEGQSQPPNRSKRRTSSMRTGLSRSQYSSTTHFTVDSCIPPLPYLEDRERQMNLRHLAKRAERASQILSTPYTPSDLQVYKQSRRRKKKNAKSVPAIWSNNVDDVSGIDISRNMRYESTPDAIEPIRRRKSCPQEGVQSIMSERDLDDAFKGKASSFRDSLPPPPRILYLWNKSTSTKSRRTSLYMIVTLVIITLVAGIAGGVMARQRRSTQLAIGDCSRQCQNGGSLSRLGDKCSCVCSRPYIGSFCQLGELAP